MFKLTKALRRSLNFGDLTQLVRVIRMKSGHLNIASWQNQHLKYNKKNQKMHKDFRKKEKKMKVNDYENDSGQNFHCLNLEATAEKP